MSTKFCCALLLTIFVSGSLQQPGCPPIITREEWGAVPPLEVVPIGDAVPYQFVHHAEGWPCYTVEDCMQACRDIQDFHMNAPDHLWWDIGYSFLIGGDGNIYEGRGWNVEGAHTQGWNTVGYGTCFIGNFMETLPEAESVNMYMRLLDCAVAEGKVRSDYQMFGHRQTKDTTCPGDQLYEMIQGWPHWTQGSPEQEVPAPN